MFLRFVCLYVYKKDSLVSLFDLFHTKGVSMNKQWARYIPCSAATTGKLCVFPNLLVYPKLLVCLKKFFIGSMHSNCRQTHALLLLLLCKSAIIDGMTAHWPQTLYMHCGMFHDSPQFKVKCWSQGVCCLLGKMCCAAWPLGSYIWLSAHACWRK
jgi:hypothetical protein